ncbi:unnamed protein product [Rhizoctonia solani]|uniref:MYND-type domain-containing protein n=1 Tax=Rhizoctonia solani TaxID=456999 RepID=A0A8H3DXJ3_9AGAM|nr:unnamed protein product [Rhizoctonia solani]
MEIPIHPRWGPPLEKYALHYDEEFLRGNIELEDDMISSAEECIQTILTVSEESDETKIELLAETITLAMLHSVLLLSLSIVGINSLAYPGLIRGCIKLMKIVKLHGVISPFSFEYGYLCFNISKVALGTCLVKNFRKGNLYELTATILENPTVDSTTLLTEHLTNLFMEAVLVCPDEPRCDWVFGWSEPPAYRGQVQSVVTESDTLDMMNILWSDRKAFFKSLSLTYTPGTSIILLLIWQYMARKGLRRALPKSHSLGSLLESYLDLLWRFTLIATPGDYGVILPAATAAMFHLAAVAKTAVDVEDSRAIINAYIKGVPTFEIERWYRQTALTVYPNVTRLITRNILPGTEDLFPMFIKTLLGRMWEIISWEGLESVMPPLGALLAGFEDVYFFFHLHGQKLPSQPLVMQAILQEMVENDFLGLIGFSIHRLYPDRESDTLRVYRDWDSCVEFRNTVYAMLEALAKVLSRSTTPRHFHAYSSEWVKHLQHNETLLDMSDYHPNALERATFRQGLLLKVVTILGLGASFQECLDAQNRVSCSYERCPSPSWVRYSHSCCSSCATWPKRAHYCSSRCQIL